MNKPTQILTLTWGILLLSNCAHDHKRGESLNVVDTGVEKPMSINNFPDNVTSLNCGSSACIKVRIFNVGQGSSAVVIFPNGKTMMIDVGASRTTEAALHINTELTNLGVTHIDYLILSHSDNDHINLVNKINAIQLDKMTALHISGEPSDYYYQNQAGMDFMSKIYTNPSKQRTIIQCNQGKRSNVSAKVYCYGNDTYGTSATPAGFPNIPEQGIYSYFLAVNVGSKTHPPTSSNHGSLVVGINYNSIKVIFPGDAEGDTEAGMAKHTPRDLYTGATFYALAHHGAQTEGSNSLPWLQLIQSQMYASSSSPHKGWYHPSGRLIHQLRTNPNQNSRLVDLTQHYVYSSNKAQSPHYCYCTMSKGILSSYTNGTLSLDFDGTYWQITNAYNRENDLVACPNTVEYC
ncbi:ComEC/Rec2 family competence protein [Marinicella sp. W31]|uniref:ComEC/Rec2 family competence protein n=1 Tax=Marinicella sp. W31 TaxID=3023713 RepID=UPI0037567B8B